MAVKSSGGKEPIIREKIVEKIVYRDREVEKEVPIKVDQEPIATKPVTPPNERPAGTGTDTKKRLTDLERQIRDLEDDNRRLR